MILIFFIGLLLLGFAIFLVPKQLQYYLMLSLQLGMIAISGYLALKVFATHQTTEYKLFELFGNEVVMVIDSLSAFFIIVINLTVLTGALYAKGYLAPYKASKTKTEMSWHFFHFFLLHFSMLLVATLREGLSFLFFWELMSVAAFFLILFESEKPEIRAAGLKFLIQMHIAFVFIIIAFLISSLSTGEQIGFESLSTYFASQKAFPLFVLFFIGFGIKAGFIPLHTWLPHAHPSAPTHISGVMSGVIIKMGIYGIARVLTYVHTDLLAIGTLILMVSVVSGIMGVVIAIVQHDFKRLLAYHSIENIGIIGIGLGLGVIGLAIENSVLATLGFAGGLLHVLNHSLFKSLLFYTSGSVYQQTHTRNIEYLGGLMKKMPATAMFFLIGAVAICGLPPFNGFVSEFFIYSALFKSLYGNSLLFSLLLLGAIVALVIIGGLAVFCFTKIFSIVFLGNPRSTKTQHSTEVSNDMLLPKYIAAFFIIAIGMFPFLLIEPLSLVAGIYVANTSALQNMSGTLSGISISLTVLVVMVAALWFIKLKVTAHKPKAIEPTWGCGYTGANAALHQYTATSYTGYIQKKAKLIVGVKKNFTPLEKDDIFPSPAKFETHSSDVLEDNFVSKPIDKLFWFLDRIAVFQTGNIQHYLLYAIVFVIIISLLSLFNII